MTLGELKIRIFAYRFVIKRFVQRLAGIWVIIHVALLTAAIFIIFDPEFGNGLKGHEISPTVEIILIVIGLIVYRLVGRSASNSD